MYDYIIIGTGIVGLASCYQLLQLKPDAKILVLDKAERIADGQTGHNSGVIHSGIYYTPGSRKALHCIAGNKLTKAFCTENDIPFQETGKFIVASHEDELENFHTLEKKAQQHKIDFKRIDAMELQEREPHVRGIAALEIPSTGIVNYQKIAEKLADLGQLAGAEYRLSHKVINLRENHDDVIVETESGDFQAKKLIVCAGVHSDRLAKMLHSKLDFAIVPFLGEYQQVSCKKRDMIKHPIYPVANPKLPFLGVHFTPTVDRQLLVGPNALLHFSREGYGRYSINLKDAFKMLSNRSVWQLFKQQRKACYTEFKNAVIRKKWLQQVQQYVPSLEASDFEFHARAGIRAQALGKNGKLMDDFAFLKTKNSLIVANAPSPAATSALSLAKDIVSELNSLA